MRAVAESCAPGMQRLRATQSGSTLEFRVEQHGGCLRAFAVAEQPQAELVLSLSGTDGVLRTSRAERGRVGTLPEDAVICVDRPGDYRLTAQSSGSGALGLGVWQAR